MLADFFQNKVKPGVYALLPGKKLLDEGGEVAELAMLMLKACADAVHADHDLTARARAVLSRYEEAVSRVQKQCDGQGPLGAFLEVYRERARVYHQLITALGNPPEVPPITPEEREAIAIMELRITRASYGLGNAVGSAVPVDRPIASDRDLAAGGEFSKLESLMENLFRLHDLNGNAVLEEVELIKLNEKIAMLHQGKDTDKHSLSTKYAQLSRSLLDGEGKPVPYQMFREHMLHVLRDIDIDIRAQQMILHQWIAEEESARAQGMAESRMQTEEQLRKERQVTDRIMNVLHDLPPLQTAMELGDLALLEEELRKWKMELLPDRFGECKGVVEAVLKLARERLLTWRGVEHTWKEVLREVKALPSDLDNLTRQSQRIFRTLKESQLTMLDLRRSDPKAMDRICEVLLAWQQRAMAHPNHVQTLIVRKAATWPQLGAFDFADLDICLRLVDREGSEVFLSRASALVEDERTAPQKLRPLLSHLETMLFFLKYTTSEDLQLAYAEFGKQSREVDPKVFEYLKWAERVYPPGSELVRISQGRDLMDGKKVGSVLKELRKAGDNDVLGPFREIFYQWALAMHGKFSLLVLPHHTQVVCLLAFQRFLETARPPHTLIAQVGTGEGKSMIIAALAIYVVVVLRKKAHVVIDDETLLERDFETFKRVFDAFVVPVDQVGTQTRPLSAVLCVSEERLAARTGESYLLSRVDPEADICYCEAKHVQSLYASIARGEKRDFDGYEERVLILDEVDALVIDEEPNDVFVYPNDELSKMATLAAGALAQGTSPEEVDALRSSSHPAAGRVVHEMENEWTRGKQMIAGEDFVYMKEVGKYCVLHAGRANAQSWSLALECRNFQDGYSQKILFQERLFVTSRPRVFRKYHRIVGLSGSIGSKPEQAFLRDTYGAVFLKVPPFLKTCRGSPFHDAVPVRLGQQQRIVYVEPTPDAQLTRLAEVALDAREKVPVLIIARDRAHADHLVDRLRHAARSRGMGVLSEDMIRPLSRTLYETNPQQWKENLNRATLALGEGGRSWRVTVADPRGGRGTDYRVDDQGVDARGGLLLIPTFVPTSRREWTQFLGRTARQDCKGQFCCILCATDYTTLSAKYKETLHADGADGGLGVIETILCWGDREVAERISGSAALYHCGVRMNELCEAIFSRRSDVLADPVAREHIVDTCQRFRWMSVREVDQSFGRLNDFDPARIVTEASDLGRPAEPPAGDLSTPRRVGVQCGSAPTAGGPKIVVFCLDCSTSMMSHDTGTHLSRFETCVACILQILQEQVLDCDFVGVVVFGPSVELVVPPMQKGKDRGVLERRISSLRPSTSGGTCFFDAVAQCLQLLNKPKVAPPEVRRWLVCLTDGDDQGSQPQNERGEIVTQTLVAGVSKQLNLLVITVGTLLPANVRIMEAWVHRVCAAGGIGKLLSERSAATIAKAFHVVAEYLAVEVGGATEC